jgi:non-ribosomal peptide synthetase component F
MQIQSPNSNKPSNSTPINTLDLQSTPTSKPPQRLHYFWERQCDVRPDAIALICELEKLTYAELDVRANQLANYFSSCLSLYFLW